MNFKSGKISSNAKDRIASKRFNIKLNTNAISTKTRRGRLKSVPYLRLKNIQRTTIGNIWKKFFQKNFFEIFFRKIFFSESRTMPKNSKRGHSGSLNVFTNRKLQKNARGYPLTESENFRKKSRIVPKKTEKIKRKKTFFGLASTFGSIKNLWFSARIEPTISGFSEN